jgi:hypothetical protein
MDHEPILDEEYLRAIEYVESLPENQSGADKAWVHRMQSAFSRVLQAHDTPG